MGSVLEKGGVVAALFFLLTIAFGFAVRALWNENQSLHRQLQEQADDKKKMAEEYAQSLRTQAEKHTREWRAQADEFAEQLMTLTTRIDELQERRVSEMRAFTEKVVNYIGHIDNFANKLEATIDVLLRASGGRH